MCLVYYFIATSLLTSPCCTKTTTGTKTMIDVDPKLKINPQIPLLIKNKIKIKGSEGHH